MKKFVKYKDRCRTNHAGSSTCPGCDPDCWLDDELMKVELFEIKDLPELDYAGWETVDFDKMEHYFDDGVNPKNTRALQRRSEHDWVYMDDWGNWVNFDMGCGETTVLEEYYQLWLKKK